MKVRKLIKKLKKLEKELGNCEVVVVSTNFASNITVEGTVSSAYGGMDRGNKAIIIWSKGDWM